MNELHVTMATEFAEKITKEFDFQQQLEVLATIKAHFVAVAEAHMLESKQAMQDFKKLK